MSTDVIPDIATIDGIFGKRFAEARKGKGLSQEAIVTALAKRGYPLHLTAVGKIERGERRVTVGEAAALADALGFTLDALIGDQGNLLSVYAVHSRESEALRRQIEVYARALLDVALTADSARLRDSDRAWLSTELANQTPAQLTTDALMYVEAAIAREGLAASGEYTRQLLRNMQDDGTSLRLGKREYAALRRETLQRAEKESAHDG
ncbi:transcriptional regulator with XRE-family HTH domain [Mycetocola sp. CAN_C7]|uniref:helix-turn-helix domain-containing protein n=1 Tax=Mycetocola sp. CAN_C7 TaxID=2787724 RepID=UPI0018CA42F4